VFYAINVLNSYGRSAGLSNQVQVPAAPTMPSPSDFHVSLSADGVECRWNANALPSMPGLRFVYRIYRREQGSKQDSVAGEIPAIPDSTTFVDHGFEWERTYQYRVTVVTYVAAGGMDQQVEGADSASVTVPARDVFPPAVPSGLQTVFSGPGQKPFIDLVWAPNTEPDLAGYNVYRREQDTQPVKLNSGLVKAPAFRDAEVLAGHQYHYSVSAIDVRGNESQPSEETSEAAP
jgi:fibronectin type 3 domain-containing protein